MNYLSRNVASLVGWAAALALYGMLTACNSLTPEDGGHVSLYAEAGTAEWVGDGEPDDFEDEGDADSVGAAAVWGDSTVDGRPVGLASEVFYRRASGTDEVFEGVDVDSERAQLGAGMRYYLDSGSRWFQPFCGLGLVASRVEWDGGGEEGDDTDLGAYGVVGAESALGEHLRAGVLYRMTAGVDYSFDEVDVSGSFDEGALLFSLGWSF